MNRTPLVSTSSVLVTALSYPQINIPKSQTYSLSSTYQLNATPPSVVVSKAG